MCTEACYHGDKLSQVDNEESPSQEPEEVTTERMRDSLKSCLPKQLLSHVHNDELHQGVGVQAASSLAGAPKGEA